MSTCSDSKVADHHLNRQALIYVRQSSMKQVIENTESTARQYALVDKARQLGWSREQIGVIDDDLGKSGSSAVHRNGFQRLVADVILTREGYQVDVAIRFKTGAIISERIKIPSSGNQLTVIDPHIIQLIDSLSSDKTAGEIAIELNRTRISHPTLKAFTTIRRAPQLGQKPRRLQLNANIRSAWQSWHLTRRKPYSTRPRLVIDIRQYTYPEKCTLAS